jgi:hypothetical protein
MSYLYVKWNSLRCAVRSPTVPSLEHGLSSLATPGTEATEACDAAGGAFRPQSREWPAPEPRRVSSRRHPGGHPRPHRLHYFGVARYLARNCGAQLPAHRSSVNGEQKRNDCFLREAATTALRTPPWLASERGCRSQRLSRA